MRAILKAFRKKRKLVIGLMSGTSADGVDAALVEIKGSGASTKARLIEFSTYPYPRDFKRFLLKNSDRSTARLDDLSQINMLISVFFAEAAKKTALKAGLNVRDIDLIGSHGQTVQHVPVPRKMFGRDVRSTLQLGSPSAIAKLTGLLTVGDFRTADVALGGSGAPLVPLYDYLTLRSDLFSRAALNIGGIANITVIPRKCRPEDVTAFDTGPGNMALDGLMLRLFGKPFDEGGKTALRGRLITRLLRRLASHPYLRKVPPKSTGRETFGSSFVDMILRQSAGCRREDIIATAAEFTALSIYQGYLSFISKKTRIQELWASGGGVHNHYIIEALRRYFQGVRLITEGAGSIPPDAKEAVCFALLANETLSGHPGNLPKVTGARSGTVLGAIGLP